MNFTHKVAVVTGGASGIGEATVRAFVDEDARVAIVDINRAAGEAAAAEYRARGLPVDFIALDVSDAAACQAAMAALAAKRGRIDYLVNCAVSFIGKGLDATTADWERSLGVNVRGAANMVTACFEPMRAQGGAIVNIASISAHVAQPNRWTYNATKGAIVALTRCMALDLAPHRIRVNTISPGWTWTPEVQKAAGGDRGKWEPVWGKYHMLRRIGEPMEIARAILFLCSDDASFITGSELPVDGGYNGIGSEGLGETALFAGSQ